MFPVNGALPWRRPSLPWVPASPVPHLRRYYGGATTSRARNPRSLMCSLPGPPCSSPSSCSPKRSRGSGGLLPGLGRLFSRRPGSGEPARGRVRDISGSQATHPAPLPCSKTPVEPSRPRHYRPCRCCPRSQHSEGFDDSMISGLTHGFDACCLRFTTGVAADHARLASGWRAAPLPGGRRTLWIASKGFELHVHPPSQGLP